MLMMSCSNDPHRGTRDLDLLGFADPSAETMLATFREVLAQDAGDGAFGHLHCITMGAACRNDRA